MIFGFGLGNCEHKHILELNEFDGDGNIITEKILCKKCNKTNVKVYEVLESQSIWNDRSGCPHNMYRIHSYKKLPDDQVLCDVSCMMCNKTDTNLYVYRSQAVYEWEIKD